MAWVRRRDERGAGARHTSAALERSLMAVLGGEYDDAEREITALLKADSGRVELYLALARIFRIRGEVGRAIRIHQNLLMRSDLGAADRTRALAELAQDFRRGGFLRRAAASYEEVLTREPRHPQALAGLVDVLAEVGEYGRAIRTHRRLARVDKSRGAEEASRLWLGLAQAEHAQGHTDAARKALKKALSRDPKNARAHAWLGRIEAERGRNKAALAAWRAVPELDREVALDVYPRLEAAYSALDRAKDYEDFLRAILDRSPDDSGARCALARSRVARGAIDEGIAELRRVLDGDPRHRDARVELGRILLAEHRHTDAVKELSELLEVLDEPRSGPAR
ncbi:MAG: tetratricopeptide repeat protein [Proteobacteria bacterium]|nr:tetratricopeptide repeat protein [Pseudomonadota bacterium]